MAYLKTANHRIHYKTFGHKRQPALLILHGFLGSWRDFSPVLPALKANFYCILPDLPGHGQTTTFNGSYSFDKTARSLLSLLDYLQIYQANLLGYSMGGRIALYVACKHSTRIHRTILESASPGLKTAAERKARRASDDAIALQLETLPFQDFLSKWSANPLFESLKQYPDAYTDMIKRRLQNNPIELANALRGLSLGNQPSMWRSLRRDRFSLMLMFGTQDYKFSILSQEMSKECELNNKSDAVLKPFLDMGHNIHLEAEQISSKAYVQAITGFLL